LWAEFRISAIGAAFTMLSVMTPLIKIISPGAVMIAGAANRKIIGITALAGPLSSIIVACTLFGIQFIAPDSLNALSVLRGASLSAWIAAFNLIPLAMFDGAKVFWWDKKAWGFSFMIAIALMATLIIYYP
jgi:Zn-dependent protease